MWGCLWRTSGIFQRVQKNTTQAGISQESSLRTHYHNFSQSIFDPTKRIYLWLTVTGDSLKAVGRKRLAGWWWEPFLCVNFQALVLTLMRVPNHCHVKLWEQNSRRKTDSDHGYQMWFLFWIFFLNVLLWIFGTQRHLHVCHGFLRLPSRRLYKRDGKNQLNGKLFHHCCKSLPTSRFCSLSFERAGLWLVGCILVLFAKHNGVTVFTPLSVIPCFRIGQPFTQTVFWDISTQPASIWYVLQAATLQRMCLSPPSSIGAGQPMS